ncbi:Nucleoside-diphosphate-sugar epimerase [Maridesulfovibrio ferrireducens]|uniref:Nucleoside-diphosphate-sugar epimerase n=1 Tax=Maridesulfovibrio ferrireducens TaxID=246191 RepID=A0A1G9CNP7_9BACT|nr:NAD(P)-dependent oxidoreductase [Maridesulfovibrio ferrireducens]SDK53323.1 Nucleoside-diphosphate-sugar epimerase [Maridesulfovibrio ferrireducens]
MNFLVTGATGMIGRRVVRILVESGDKVIAPIRSVRKAQDCFNDLGDGILFVDWNTENISNLLKDVEDLHVIHLAAPGVIPGERNWDNLIEGAVSLSVQTVLALKNASTKCFIHTGSCLEYGPSATMTTIPETHCLDGLCDYGAAKAASYLCAKAAASKVGIRFICARLFGVYGEEEAPGRLIPYLVSKLRNGEEVDLTLGEQVRDFLYVDDAAKALIELARNAECLEHSVYNVCSGAGIQICDMALKISKAVGADNSLLKFGARPYREDEPMYIVGDNKRLQDSLVWSQSFSIDEGLRQTVTRLLQK